MKLANTLVTALGLLAFVNVAQAAVITTVEWESKPGAPWTYTPSRPNIDCTMPPSPSGGCALRFEYPAGTYSTSFGGGRAEYALSGQPLDIYLGAWMRYSPGFVFHPIGQKVNFFIMTDRQNCSGTLSLVNIAIGYQYGNFAAGNQICWGNFAQGNYANLATWDETAHTGEWHWYEMHVKMNTPGGSDGTAELWIDGVLYMRHTNIQLREAGATNGFGALQHTAEYGGGGSTIASTQYWWVDHTVISTTRIGMPSGSGTTTDSVAPAAPVGFKFH